MLGLILRMVRRLALPALLALSLAANVLSFTSAAFVGLVSAAVERIGFETPQARQAAERRRVARRIASRTARGATRSVGAVAAQALPWAGAASVIAFTAWELADACATLTDLAEIDPVAAPDAQSVCGIAALDLPTQFGLTGPAEATSPQTGERETLP